MNNLKIVEVEWFDAQSGNFLIELKELIEEDILLTKSCGYLLHKDKEKIILIFMLFGDHSTKHFQIIPREMVKKIRYLK